MSAGMTKPEYGSSSATLEGSNLTEPEIDELLDIFFEQMLENQLREYLQGHCRRPLNQIQNRLRRMNRHAEKVLTTVR